MRNAEKVDLPLAPRALSMSLMKEEKEKKYFAAARSFADLARAPPKIRKAERNGTELIRSLRENER